MRKPILLVGVLAFGLGLVLGGAPGRAETGPQAQTTAKSVHKTSRHAAKTAPLAATPAASDQASGRKTIPMDFSGMARRGADLNGPDKTPGDSDDEHKTRPTLGNGLSPGMNFQF